jgi:flagellar hook-basal body complex protein FliE
MKEISLHNNLETAYGIQPQAKETKEGTESFGEMLKGAIGDVAKLQREADNAIQELAAGENKDIHRTMIALEKADVSFQLMMQVRNKVIAAYEEIMRMQV